VAKLVAKTLSLRLARRPGQQEPERIHPRTQPTRQLHPDTAIGTPPPPAATAKGAAETRPFPSLRHPLLALPL
jgi:hypothetical protein